MRSRALTRSEAFAITDHRCSAGPADVPFTEQHKGFSISYVRKGSFGYQRHDQAFELVAGSILLVSALYQRIRGWEAGIILWAGAPTFGRLTVAVSYVLHDISALIMLGGIFIHIYLSTFGEPGTFQAMTRGAVSEAWAWTFHPAWYKEVTGRDPRQAYEEARRQMESKRS